MSDCKTCVYNNGVRVTNCTHPHIRTASGIDDCRRYEKRHPYRLQEVLAENAQLREERDKWKRDYEWLRARMDEVAESHKRIQEHDGRLYELVLYMWDFSCVAHDEPHTSKEELNYSVEVWKRMRELGMVDE